MAQWIERWTAKQRVPFRFPVRAHDWVAGRVRGNHTRMFLSLYASLPLSENKIFFKKLKMKKNKKTCEHKQQ